MNAYVYCARLDYSELQRLIQKIQPQVVLSWDIVHLDFSGELRENGVAFHQGVEIRWEKGREYIHVLVLSDQEMQEEGLHPVPGHWTAEEIAYRGDGVSEPSLVSTIDRRYAPQFQRYPIIDRDRGHLVCRVFYRDGVAVFVSPRGIQP